MGLEESEWDGVKDTVADLCFTLWHLVCCLIAISLRQLVIAFLMPIL